MINEYEAMVNGRRRLWRLMLEEDGVLVLESEFDDGSTESIWFESHQVSTLSDILHRFWERGSLVGAAGRNGRQKVVPGWYPGERSHHRWFVGQFELYLSATQPQFTVKAMGLIHHEDDRVSFTRGAARAISEALLDAKYEKE